MLSPLKEPVLRKVPNMEQPELKLCGKCKVKQPVSQFYQAGKTVGGKPKYKPRCKPCYNASARDTYREKAPKRKADAGLAPSGGQPEHGPPQVVLVCFAMLYQSAPAIVLTVQSSLAMQEAPTKQPKLGAQATVLPDFSYLESPEAQNVAIQFYSRSSTLRSAEKKVKVYPWKPVHIQLALGRPPQGCERPMPAPTAEHVCRRACA